MVDLAHERCPATAASTQIVVAEQQEHDSVLMLDLLDGANWLLQRAFSEPTALQPSYRYQRGGGLLLGAFSLALSNKRVSLVLDGMLLGVRGLAPYYGHSPAFLALRYVGSYPVLFEIMLETWLHARPKKVMYERTEKSA